MRASRCLRAKVPKPIRVTGLPAATESAGIAVLAGESAEADQSNGLAGGDGVDDGSENALNSGSGILLAEFALGRNFLDEFSFVHVNSPLL